ncbi:MAG TPA: hypothetical protein VMG59_06340 [Phycisphaerae bacterium]|nr:hypothetical protein [Phycisphaerae bacterium]
MTRTEHDPEHPEAIQIEPIWPVLIATLVICSLYALLPMPLSLGPGWLLGLIVVILQIPYITLRVKGIYRTAQVLGMIILGIITCFIAFSLGVLVYSVPKHSVAPAEMLAAAGQLWISNVLVFSLWYWRLDAGGPHARAKKGHHQQVDCFLFPQMLLKDHAAGWSPRFMDYLFLAFNTSTAFSPSDTAVLSRWAKPLVMLQSLISLSLVALVAARAVGII